MADAIKELPAFRSYDLYPGPRRCVRKAFSTHFVSLNQWKIALKVESRPQILKVSNSKGAMNSDFCSSRINMVNMYIFLDQLGFHM